MVSFISLHVLTIVSPVACIFHRKNHTRCPLNCPNRRQKVPRELADHNLPPKKRIHFESDGETTELDEDYVPRDMWSTQVDEELKRLNMESAQKLRNALKEESLKIVNEEDVQQFFSFVQVMNQFS